MLLKQLFEEQGKKVTFCFGRFNPPTIGHKQVFETMKKQGGDMMIFTSTSQDKKKNPLDYSTKIDFLKKILPEYASYIVEDASLNTIDKVAAYLNKQGYTEATFVAGSDRLDAMASLLQEYNGKTEGKKGPLPVTFKFKNLDFVSSGEREDGAEGVAGISASGAREAALQGDFDAFEKATGAGEHAQGLYDAVRNGMGINESLEEAISVDSAVRSIVSTADSITKTYNDLKTMAEKWVYNNGTLKGFHRNAAGVGKRWYDTFFWNKMENDLRTLIEKNPKAADKLKDFFNIERDDKGHVSFTIIGRSLPRILNQVGEKMGDDDLKRFAANWHRKQADYEDFLGRVEAEVNDDEDDDSTPAPKQPKDNVVGRQNAAAEDIVNQILRSIDKKVAGEIRNAIAREPNKLQALQRELAKRNIKVGESLDEDWRKKLAAAGMAGMIGLSGAAGAADRPSDTKKEPIVATIVIDGETKTLDLTPKGFNDVRDAEKWLDKFLDDRGIVDWRGKIERSPGSQGDGTGRYQRILIQ